LRACPCAKGKRCRRFGGRIVADGKTAKRAGVARKPVPSFRVSKRARKNPFPSAASGERRRNLWSERAHSSSDSSRRVRDVGNFPRDSLRDVGKRDVRASRRTAAVGRRYFRDRGGQRAFAFGM